MIVCFPKNFQILQKSSMVFKKDDWWENEGESFRGPLRIDCEKHLA
jgi:hypothetical protein